MQNIELLYFGLFSFVQLTWRPNILSPKRSWPNDPVSKHPLNQTARRLQNGHFQASWSIKVLIPTQQLSFKCSCWKVQTTKISILAFSKIFWLKYFLFVKTSKYTVGHVLIVHLLFENIFFSFFFSRRFNRFPSVLFIPFFPRHVSNYFSFCYCLRLPSLMVCTICTKWVDNFFCLFIHWKNMFLEYGK